MSRVAKKPVTLPADVEASLKEGLIILKGSKGTIEHRLDNAVQAQIEDKVITVSLKFKTSKLADAIAGTTRALVQNMVTGVSRGFEKKLMLIGVGYRAQAQGSTLNLALGFSHPIKYDVPKGITVETPSQTEILVKGIDRQLVGQVSADIRSFRPPEPYKGKGVRYANEVIQLKEGKKK
jgi:large subunit ribosomal protein L6